MDIYGKGCHSTSFLGQHPPPFLRFLPLLEIEDFPNFFKTIEKIKVLNDSFN